MNPILEKLFRLQQITPGAASRGARFSREMENLRKEIPDRLLRSFDHLMRHGRPGVAQLSETGSCGSCHLRVPPATATHVAQVEDEIHHCPHCGCILYREAAKPEALLIQNRSRPASRARATVPQA